MPLESRLRGNDVGVQRQWRCEARQLALVLVNTVHPPIQRTEQPRGVPTCYVTFGGTVTISVVSDQLVGESAGGGLTEWLVGQITR